MKISSSSLKPFFTINLVLLESKGDGSMNGKDLITVKKSNSSLKILGICLAVVTVIFVAIWIFKVSPTNLVFAGTLLLCPLLHVWMMKSGGHKH